MVAGFLAGPAGHPATLRFCCYFHSLEKSDPTVIEGDEQVVEERGFTGNKKNGWPSVAPEPAVFERRSKRAVMVGTSRIRRRLLSSFELGYLSPQHRVFSRLLFVGGSHEDDVLRGRR
jgi:hypothetical protein